MPPLCALRTSVIWGLLGSEQHRRQAGSKADTVLAVQELATGRFHGILPLPHSGNPFLPTGWVTLERAESPTDYLEGIVFQPPRAPSFLSWHENGCAVTLEKDTRPGNIKTRRIIGVLHMYSEP